MGGDGGSLNNSRMELVRMRKELLGKAGGKAAGTPQVDDAHRRAQWSTCALSRVPLRKPVVGCRLGSLYNKDEVIRFLLDKPRRKLPENKAAFGHIRSLDRDLAPATLQWVADAAEHPGRFQCPLTRVEATGKAPFVHLQGCGCVLSERAHRELSSAAHDAKSGVVCVVCGSTDAGPVVTLHPDAVERQKRRAALVGDEVERARNGPAKRTKRNPRGPQLSESADPVYASLFVERNGTEGRRAAGNSAGEFTGVSLRPAGN